MADHNKESLQFWMTCPECGHKFGVSPGTIFKYMGRLANSHVEMVNKRIEEYEQAEDEDEDGKEGS